VKLEGDWRSYSGRTYLQLTSKHTFTLEDASGRYWGRWKARFFGRSLTFEVEGPAAAAGTITCSYDTGTESGTGSLRLEITSNRGSPLDGKWYRSGK
jgi:hypothetical protein